VPRSTTPAGRSLSTCARNPELDLADVAFTLHEGRHQFGAERRVLSAASTAEAADLLEQLDPRQVFTHTAAATAPPVVFLLPGGGAQYPRMAAELYAEHALFRRLVDDGFRLAEQQHGLQLRPLLFPEGDAVQRRPRLHCSTPRCSSPRCSSSSTRSPSC
jgi:acyl transferase domain-containing protein